MLWNIVTSFFQQRKSICQMEKIKHHALIKTAKKGN